jgi:hypothetical protein
VLMLLSLLVGAGISLVYSSCLLSLSYRLSLLFIIILHTITSGYRSLCLPYVPPPFFFRMPSSSSARSSSAIQTPSVFLPLTPAQRAEAFSGISGAYSGVVIELHYQTPFQLLMAVILSAQTTDKQVNRITPPLFMLVHTPADLLSWTIEDLTFYTRYINYYNNKSKHILATAKMLVECHGGQIPCDIPTLMTLPGVGVKTAKVVSSVLYGTPVV